MGKSLVLFLLTACQIKNIQTGEPGNVPENISRSGQLPSCAGSHHKIGKPYKAGAFSSHSNAKKLRRHLQKTFSNVNIEASNYVLRRWHRVRIGPIHDSLEVERAVLSLQTYSHLQSIVVTE